MSGMDLTVSIIIWGFIILHFIFLICCFVYAWKHFRTAEDYLAWLKNIEWEEKKRKMRENRSIDKALWGD